MSQDTRAIVLLTVVSLIFAGFAVSIALLKARLLTVFGPYPELASIIVSMLLVLMVGVVIFERISTARKDLWHFSTNPQHALWLKLTLLLLIFAIAAMLIFAANSRATGDWRAVGATTLVFTGVLATVGWNTRLLRTAGAKAGDTQSN